MTSENEGMQPWHSYEPMERYESLFPLLPDYVAHHTIGGRHLPSIGLSSKHHLGLRKKLFTALIADEMEISIAYAEKRYAKDFNESRWLGLTDRIDSVYIEGRKYLGWYLSSKKDEIYDEYSSLRDLSWHFFYRSIGSLDAAKRLSELGYLCEVATILRSALEQFAFCSKLLELNESEDLKTVRPIQCLNHFKKFVPDSGKLYGLMSKYTHFEFDHHTHFFAYSPKGNQTIRQGAVLRAYATQLLFLTMACISKYILVASPTQFKDVPKSVLDISTFIENVVVFSDDVQSMLPLDEILAKMNTLLQDIVKEGT